MEVFRLVTELSDLVRGIGSLQGGQVDHVENTMQTFPLRFGLDAAGCESFGAFGNSNLVNRW